MGRLENRRKQRGTECLSRVAANLDTITPLVLRTPTIGRARGEKWRGTKRPNVGATRLLTTVIHAQAPLWSLAATELSGMSFDHPIHLLRRLDSESMRFPIQ